MANRTFGKECGCLPFWGLSACLPCSRQKFPSLSFMVNDQRRRGTRPHLAEDYQQDTRFTSRISCLTLPGKREEKEAPMLLFISRRLPALSQASSSLFLQVQL